MEQKEYGIFLAQMLYKSGVKKLPWVIGYEAAKWLKIEFNRLNKANTLKKYKAITWKQKH